MSHSSDAQDVCDEEGMCPPGQENTGRWTSEEHRLFLEGLDQHGKGWKKIATLIQTRTVVQIRTHAQKYFQKLQRAQASGAASLDRTTIMSTMDAGKMRPAGPGGSSRNLRSTTALDGMTIGKRISSLRNRQKLRSNKRRARGMSSSDSEAEDSNADAKSFEGSDAEEEEEEEEDKEEEEEDYYEDENIKDRDGEDNNCQDGDNESRLDKLLEMDKDSYGIDQNAQPNRLTCTARGQRGRRAQVSAESKPQEKNSTLMEGGAAEARARAWDVAAKALAHAGAKRDRAESRMGSNRGLSIAGAIKDPALAYTSPATGISPTSVADINFASFPATTNVHSSSSAEVAHMQQVAPGMWCHKPQAPPSKAVTATDDAFRWFVDQQSMAAPGGFVLARSGSWSEGSDTEVSITAGVDGMELDSELSDPQIEDMVDKCLVNSNAVDPDATAIVHPAKRRCTGSSTDLGELPHRPPTTHEVGVNNSHPAPLATGSVPTGPDIPTADESDDITIPGLWLDDPQETASFLSLSLSANSCALHSMPSMDEDEVLGFMS